MHLECARCLIHQGDPIGKEQDALDPACAHQEIDQSDHGAGLAGARCHDEQRLALAILLEMLGDGADRTLLIGPLDNLAVDRLSRERLPGRPPLDQKLQLVALIEAADLARGIIAVVPDPVLVAVGIENHRALTVTRFQQVSIQLGLLLARAGVLPGALCLDQPHRLAVRAPQHIIDKADAFVVGHAFDTEFSVFGLVQRPARLSQQEVDEAIAGLGLVVVVAVGPGFGGFSRLGHFGAKLLQFLVKVLPVEQQPAQFAIPGVELGLLGLELDECLFQHLIAAR